MRNELVLTCTIDHMIPPIMFVSSSCTNASQTSEHLSRRAGSNIASEVHGNRSSQENDIHLLEWSYSGRDGVDGNEAEG